ncbi:CHAP domain-containing protein [Bradyrhizobium liaoningense]|uniref:CHAP domain-containing protein n=1 Tax=Bradyrhizobium liaoningense TaxID=43992 RepID=UPI001BA48FB3|nr:CHAP domain-containing protein [Bradyrhizobium liaoningense]MBR0940978.1 CHAP domain-containing protein [Bradyrhizobium liaoningense]
MPNEQEELKLVVSLVDNASAGLDKIVEKTKEMGGPQVKEAHEKMRRGTEELNKVFKEASGGFGDAFKALGTFRGGLVAGAGGLALFGVEMTRQIGELKKWAEELRGISQAARQIGVDPAAMKNIISQFEAVGVSADQTKANLGKMSEAVADLNRQGSALRRELLHMAGPTPQAQASMREFLDKVVHARTEEERYNAVAEARNNVLKNALANGYTLQEATNRANEFASHFWDKTIAAKDRLNQLSAEERRIQDERIAKARQYADITGDINSEWSDIIEELKAPFLQPAIDSAEKLLGVFKSIHEWVSGLNKETKRREELDKVLPETNPLRSGFGEWRKRIEQRQFYLEHPDEAIPGSTKGAEAKANAAAQKDNTDATKKSTDATGKLDETTKNLLNALQSPYQPTSYTGGGTGRNPLLQNASFTTGGSQGFSYGGGGYGPFGGGQGFQGHSGGGSHAGGSANYGSQTGGPTGSSESGPAGDPSVPSDILAKARSVALHGGPRAVEQFMASQGYPKAGNWCGEFAASVVKSVGGTPPKGAAVASNWRNWGAPVAPGDVQPGDIAVADRGVRTGATGSHVTIVEDVNRKAGTFTGLGGNQGRGFESQFALKGYSFRRGGPPNGSQVGAGTGAGAGDTPATADGAHGAGGSDERAKMMAEVNKDPATKELLYRMMRSEGGGAPTAEALFNRTQMIRQKVPGYKIGDELRSGFYGPINKGQTRGPLSENERAKYDKTLAEVVGGSNYIQGRTNQGMASDPGARLPGRVPIPGSHEVYNYWEGRRKGVDFSVADSARFAREQLDRKMAAANKVEGSGKISVDVNAPKGTKVDAQGGGIFKDVEINRQTQMERARSGPETISI